MNKQTIFLSHIVEEKELAAVFKTEIETQFLGMVEVFVSSDEESVQTGSNWLERITEGLRSCSAMLLLCSPTSVKRPWINFEAGAGWARSIDIAPICHSGLRPVDLPLPLSLLQGVEANDPDKIGRVFSMIARHVGSREPNIETAALTAKIQAFEEPYIIKVRLGNHVVSLKSKSPTVFQLLKNSDPDTTVALSRMKERDYVHVRDALDALQNEGALQYSYRGTSMMLGESDGGMHGDLTIRQTRELHNLITALGN